VLARYNHPMAQRHRHFPRNKIPLSETIEGWLLIASIGMTIWLFKTDFIATVVRQASESGLIVGAFIEGFFFTSILTTPPAIIALAESASYIAAWKLALIGAAGAVCGDLLVFRFVQSRLVERILSVALSPRILRWGDAIAHSPFWWLGPLCGAAVIASPFPDEVGLVMMGLSSIRFVTFIPLSFAANAAGIFLIALAAQRLG